MLLFTCGARAPLMLSIKNYNNKTKDEIMSISQVAYVCICFPNFIVNKTEFKKQTSIFCFRHLLLTVR